MNQIPCDSLDDFLAGDLADDRRRELETHLVDCPACRAEVAEWQTLCRTLRAATETMEVPPADLSSRVERGPIFTADETAKTGRTWRVAALIAASLLAAALFSEVLRPTLPPDAERALPKTLVAAAKPAPPRPSIEVHGTVIGVPIDIGNPNVTVVWLYPEAVGPEAEK
jgi:anti-sigma factor RsiW